MGNERGIVGTLGLLIGQFSRRPPSISDAGPPDSNCGDDPGQSKL
jgi:hypothetical protein